MKKEQELKDISSPITLPSCSRVIQFNEETIIQSIKKIVLDSIPNVLYLLSFFLVSTINILYISHFSDPALSASMVDGIGIAATWVSVTTFLIFSSLNTGTSTLAAQAHGSKNYELVGLYLHRAIVLRLAGLMPSFLFLIFSEQILTFLGISPAVAFYAGVYCKSVIPGVLLLAMSDTLKAYLIAHGIFQPLLYIQSIGVGTHFLLCDTFVRSLEMSLHGTAYAFTLSQLIILILTVGYIGVWAPTTDTLFWFTKKSLKNLWWQFKKEAQIAMFMYLEWVAYEIIVILSGLLGEIQLQSIIIAYNITWLAYMPGGGIGVTVTTYIASAMGEGKIPKIERYMKATIILWLILVGSISIPLLLFAEIIVRWYTQIKQVIEIASKLIRIYACYFIMDVGQVLVVAVIKGTGKEEIGTKLFLFSMYGCGFLSSYILVFGFGYQTSGFMYGMAIGVSVMFILGLRVVKQTDLYKQLQLIQQRTEESSGDDPNTSKNDLADPMIIKMRLIEA